jgi:DNA-binding MarR family transcriptional regulator
MSTRRNPPRDRKANRGPSSQTPPAADDGTRASAVLREFRTFRGLVLGDAIRQTLKFLHRHNASFASIKALMALQERGDQSVSQLAAEIGLSVAATSQLLDRLVHDKLVARTESPLDRRRKELALTASGRTFLNRMDGTYSVAAERVLGTIPAAALEDLERALAAVNDSLKR